MELADLDYADDVALFEESGAKVADAAEAVRDQSQGGPGVELANLDYADDVALFEESGAEVADDPEALRDQSRGGLVSGWATGRRRSGRRFQPHRSTWKRRSHQGGGPLQIYLGAFCGAETNI